MATVAEAGVSSGSPAQRFVLHGMSWCDYEAVLKVVAGRAVRVTYDRGALELMSPSYRHDRSKTLLGRLVETVTEELEIPCVGAGSTTLRRQLADRGLEPDEAYYLANVPRILDNDTIDLDTDPPPDLCIEVEVSRSALDRMGIYAAMGVPEVWRYDGEDLKVARLGDDGIYVPCDHSPSFPFLPLAEIVRHLRDAQGSDHSAWNRRFRRWVRQTLAPEHGPRDHAD